MRQDSTRGGSPSGVPKRKRGAGYPARPSHFFHKYARWLAKSCAANFVGADGCWLLTIVAATEDSIRYHRPPSFFNTQLAPLCGCSIDKLSSTRRRCIHEGLLHYEPGGKSIPGIYWVLLPDHAEGLADGPIGEVESDFLPLSAEEFPKQRRGTARANPETSAEPPFLPCPEPSPSKAGEAERVSDKPGSQADAWAEVVTELDSVGMADSLGTVEAARGKGLTPDRVLAVLAVYRERKREFRGPGAIHWRITRGSWPDSDSTGPNLDAKKHEHLAAETRKRIAEEQQHAAEVAEQRRELDRLEEQLGPEIDALPAEELEQFVPDGPARKELRSNGWRGAFVRGKVLQGFQESRLNGGSLS